MGNLGTGFGGPIGLGSLNLSSDGTSINATLTKGTGGFNDGFVIYIDSTAGGLSDTSTYTDSADYLRQTISGFNGTLRSTLTFPTGFAPDFAIALTPAPAATFGGLWSLSNTSNFTFINSVNLTPNNSTTNATYTFNFLISDIGLSGSGGSFNFVSSYLDSTNAYRSNESIGTTLSGIPADGNGNFGQNPVTAANFQTCTFGAIPEPSSLALLTGPALVGAWFFRRRRRA